MAAENTALCGSTTRNSYRHRDFDTRVRRIGRCGCHDLLVDRVGLGDLSEIYPAGLIDLLVVEEGCREGWRRLLPAQLVVLFLLARALFAGDCYQEVLRRGTGVGVQPVGGWHLPDKATVVR
ncbi:MULTISPECIES: transposase domain-containing protein [unclassified Nocardia]|uniref:transposase domain-containing protein n=1 Tax=unclassified Nocardia TaxID=2637762 RepID=UPI001CE478D3|nr:transposase domain-containing protein [Nocardia sp. JCM 34519]